MKWKFHSVTEFFAYFTRYYLSVTGKNINIKINEVLSLLHINLMKIQKIVARILSKFLNIVLNIYKYILYCFCILWFVIISQFRSISKLFKN